MRFEAAIKGDLKAFMQQQKEAAEIAVTTGIMQITDGIKTELRAQVTSAGLGVKLAKSWQANVYPKGQRSISAAGWVFSKAPKLIRAFNDGTVIRSKKGLFLAIPTNDAPKRGVDGKRINPSNFPEHSLGKLQFVYRPGQTSLLVVNSKSPANKGGGSSIVMFILVPQVKLAKRLDYQSGVARWEPQLANTILKNWPEVNSNA